MPIINPWRSAIIGALAVVSGRCACEPDVLTAHGSIGTAWPVPSHRQRERKSFQPSAKAQIGRGAGGVDRALIASCASVAIVSLQARGDLCHAGRSEENGLRVRRGGSLGSIQAACAALAAHGDADMWFGSSVGALQRGLLRGFAYG